MSEATWILFSGSMKATPAMLEYTRRAVNRAIDKGYMVVVGDNPKGVDLEVIKTCFYRGKRFVVVSVNGERRALRHLNQKRPIGSKHTAEDYAERDRAMVDMADEAMFIYNGTSQGTAAAHAYAVKQGIKAHMVTFDVAGKAQVNTTLALIPEPIVVEPLPKQRKLI